VRVYTLISGTVPNSVVAKKRDGRTRLTPQNKVMSVLGNRGEQRSSTSKRNRLPTSGHRYDGGGVMVFLKNTKHTPDPRVVARVAAMVPVVTP